MNELDWSKRKSIERMTRFFIRSIDWSFIAFVCINIIITNLYKKININLDLKTKQNYCYVKKNSNCVQWFHVCVCFAHVCVLLTLYKRFFLFLLLFFSLDSHAFAVGIEFEISILNLNNVNFIIHTIHELRI